MDARRPRASIVPIKCVAPSAVRGVLISLHHASNQRPFASLRDRFTAHARGILDAQLLARLDPEVQDGLHTHTDAQHELIKLITREKYPAPMYSILAPDDETGDIKACLDLGCGSGSW